MHCGCKLNYVWWLWILGTKSLKHIVCATKLCLVEYLKAIQHCNLVIGVWNVFTSNFDPWIETVQSLSDPTRFAILCLSKVFKLILIVSLVLLLSHCFLCSVFHCSQSRFFLFLIEIILSVTGLPIWSLNKKNVALSVVRSKTTHVGFNENLYFWNEGFHNICYMILYGNCQIEMRICHFLIRN